MLASLLFNIIGFIYIFFCNSEVIIIVCLTSFRGCVDACSHLLPPSLEPDFPTLDPPHPPPLSIFRPSPAFLSTRLHTRVLVKRSGAQRDVTALCHLSCALCEGRASVRLL